MTDRRELAAGGRDVAVRVTAHDEVPPCIEPRVARGAAALAMWALVAGCGSAPGGIDAAARSHDAGREADGTVGEDSAILDDGAIPAGGFAGFADVSGRVSAPPMRRPSERGSITAGVALMDLDEDGLLDVLATHHAGELVVLRNGGGLRFEPSAGIRGLDGIARSTCIALADVDDDGRLDVLVGTDEGATLRCARGGGVFEDCTASSGLGGLDGHVSGASFGDLDGDGTLDVYVSRYDALDGPDWPQGLPNALYRGVGGGRFEEVGGAPGSAAGEVGATLAAGLTDVDGDALLDVIVVNDFGPFARPNQVYLNRGDLVFEERGAALGLAQRVFGMSLSIADLDGDGSIDAYVSNAAHNLLLTRGADGRFVDRARELGASVATFRDPDPPQTEPPRYRDFGPDGENPTPEMVEFIAAYGAPERAEWTLTSWGSAPLDADLDGRLDLFVANGIVGLGSLVPEGPGQPNRLLLWRGAGFETASAAMVPDLRGASRGAAAGDLDGDGDLEIVWVDNGWDQEPGVRVLENLGGGGGWLAVALEGTRSNRHGLGARVTIEIGGVTQLREVRTDVGFASAVPPIAHFGVGAASEVDVVVRWPSGAEQRVGAVPTGGVVTLREPE